MMHSTRSNRLFLLATLAGSLLAPFSVGVAHAGDDPVAAAKPAATTRTITAWNIAKKTGLGIQGYDPVAYFPEGGSAPAKGNASISTTYQGVTYNFASTAHRDAFLANPARYEPAHGGWCSWAMREGDKVDVDPKTYIVNEGRLFLFYNGLLGNTRTKWLAKNQADEAKEADTQWKKLSGEEARSGELAMAAPTSLHSQLDALKAKFSSAAPAETIALYEQGIRDVAESGVMDKVLKVGDTAPDFTLPDATGASTNLHSLLAKGPVVMVWYRGAWCPFCNLELHAYQEMQKEFEAAGATIVAISPMTPDNSLTVKEKQQLAFPVLSDERLKVAEQYGLAYTLPEKVSNSFKGRLDLAKFNGDDSNRLPISATYVVDTQGKIQYAFTDADYRTRAEPSEVLKAVRSLPKLTGATTTPSPR
jgi:peroxiredoxin/YHS domain-containing protein